MGPATMASEFESWVRTTVSQMPFFDYQKGGFIGVPVLKKTLLASVPQHILDNAKSANPVVNLAAELNSIFKQGGLTQELLAECERRRQAIQVAKEAKDEGESEKKKKETTIGEGQKTAKTDKLKEGQQYDNSGKTASKEVDILPGTGGVPIDLPSNGTRTNKPHDSKPRTPVQADFAVDMAKKLEKPDKPALKSDQKVVKASDDDAMAEKKKEMRERYVATESTTQAMLIVFQRIRCF